MTDFFSQINGKQALGDETQSILRHIEVLLNSKKGCLSHMPEYGLPDYGIHPEQRSAKQYFIEAVESLVQRYEPRIDSLKIKEVVSERVDCILQLALTARIKSSDTIQFNTLVISGGGLIVQDNCKPYD